MSAALSDAPILKLGFDSAANRVQTQSDWGCHIISDATYLIESIFSEATELAVTEVANESTEKVRIPPSISDSLRRFYADYPPPRMTCFVMMRFGETDAHRAIMKTIRDACKPLQIAALRADDKEYHDDMFPNVLTYLHGSTFGIAVYERLEEETFNPNVSLEVGYIMAIPKPILILKDQTLKQLNADLVGKLYKEFNPQDPHLTIPPHITKWLKDHDLNPSV